MLAAVDGRRRRAAHRGHGAVAQRAAAGSRGAARRDAASASSSSPATVCLPVYRRQLHAFPLRRRRVQGRLGTRAARSPGAPRSAGERAHSHLGGSFEEIAYAESEVAAGRHAESPYVLAVQPGVVDPSRAPGRPAHALDLLPRPAGSTLDVSGVDRRPDRAVRAGLSRPRPRERRRGRRPRDRLTTRTTSAATSARGLQDLRQTIVRPALRWNPYRTPIEGHYLCSSSTPPGPGVHGRCGELAALSASGTCSGSAGSPISARPRSRSTPGALRMNASGPSATEPSPAEPTRCRWATGPFLEPYHDQEWGVPVHDDRRHFEFLVLESAQAGLSWLTILKRRDGYRRAFLRLRPGRGRRLRPGRRRAAPRRRRHHPQPAQGRERDLERPGVPRDPAQSSARSTATSGALSGARRSSTPGPTDSQIPAETALSKEVSADLRRRGFWFLGPGRLLRPPPGDRASSWTTSRAAFGGRSSPGPPPARAAALGAGPPSADPAQRTGSKRAVKWRS